MERVEVPAEEGLSQPDKPANTKTVEEVTGRPEWLPENFKSVEEFLESHNNLRADHTRKSQELSELKKAQSTSGEQSDDDTDQANLEDTEKNEEKAESGEQVLPGVTNEFAREISDYAWENGSLTEDHYSKLAEAGYSREVVDQYMAGQVATTNAANQSLINAGGGQEQVQAMFDWAAQNMSDSEVQNYNSKFASGGPDALMAMEHLKARFESSGEAPTGRTVTGGNAPASNTSVFKSVAQVQEAMSDPRYRTDPAYRREVAEKLGRSDVL